MPAFKKGDLVVECRAILRRTSELLPADEQVEMGIVMEVHENDVYSVLFPVGKLYTFGSYCQLAKEWLEDDNF
jgi:hypothetical protein